MSLRPRPAPTASAANTAPALAGAATPKDAAQPAQAALYNLLKAGAIDKAQIEAALQTYIATNGAPTVTYDQLNPTEKAIAQLQVDHQDVGGLTWLNDAHYEALRASNNIHSDLDRRLHAYKNAKQTVEGKA